MHHIIPAMIPGCHRTTGHRHTFWRDSSRAHQFGTTGLLRRIISWCSCFLASQPQVMSWQGERQTKRGARFTLPSRRQSANIIPQRQSSSRPRQANQAHQYLTTQANNILNKVSVPRVLRHELYLGLRGPRHRPRTFLKKHGSLGYLYQTQLG